uniref:G-protein coupled receptors family 3 profile domain-containing protein n=1 Tax=Denticeps clupeoides TaxID=299321 RepID=A0AAY4CKD3_9TELE
MWLRASQRGLLTFGLCTLLASWVQSNCKMTLNKAYAPGDIIIGIISSSHTKVLDLYNRTRPEEYICTDFDLVSFARMLADIYTINVINDSGFLPGVRLGYTVCDPCADATKSLQCVVDMLSENNFLPVMCDYTEFRPDVKVFLGSRYSELSIAVAKLLSLYMIPQVGISTTASATILSDKLRYLSFLRVIPSDLYQTEALAKLMDQFSWDWIGVVSIDDDYGKSALQSFLLNAEKAHVCVAYQEVIPYYLGNGETKQKIKQVVAKVRASNAQVVLLILRPELVQNLFEEAIQTNTTRTWIASDAWSMYGPLATMKDINKVGDVFGFTFTTGRIEGLENYLRNLTIGPGETNSYIEEYKQLRFNCSSPSSPFQSPLACSIPDPLSANDDYLLNKVELSELYSESVAIWAIAHALKEQLECNDSSCPGEMNFPPWKLLAKLKSLNFTLDNNTLFFDQNGDFNDGYDLINWERSGNRRIFKTQNKNRIFDLLINLMKDLLQITVSRCAVSCKPGTRKSDNNSCCYTCIPCDEGTYTNSEDQSSCQTCPIGTWSLKGTTKCAPRTVKYLQWFEPYPITLLAAALIGFAFVILSLTCYIVQRDSPFIKAANLQMSCFMMLGLAVSFGSVIAFMDKPNIHLCRAQQTMYAMGFTLCVSCILVKAFRTFLAFMAFDPVRQERLGKLYNPFVTMITVTSFQGLICTLWLTYDSPDVDNTPPSNQSMIHVLQCTGGSNIGFAVMHSYIALLAFICFLLAFKGRKIPQDYNETGIIIFSMLIHLFVWLCFIPIYITRNESRPVVQASAILVSNFGIIFCHLVPKCFRALCDSSAHLRNILTTFAAQTETPKLSPCQNHTIGLHHPVINDPNNEVVATQL